MADLSNFEVQKPKNETSGALISVIVPVYNAEDYLAACVESILRQTYRNLEILLIDDGSTDSTPEICSRYADNDDRIRVFRQENKGVSAARNAGLDRMTGAYFTFVDSDDTLTEKAIELLSGDISEYSADIASAGFGAVSSDGTVTCKNEDHTLTVYSGIDMLRLSLEDFDITTSACAKLYKSAVFGGVRFCEGRNIHEDGFFLFMCFTLSPTFVQRNESVYFCCYHQGSNSKSAFSEKYFDMLYFCDRKKEIIQKDFPELNDRLINMELRTNLQFLDVLCRTVDKSYREVQRSCIRLVKKHYHEFHTDRRHLRRLAWITVHHLYPLYKKAVYFKYHR